MEDWKGERIANKQRKTIGKKHRLFGERFCKSLCVAIGEALVEQAFQPVPFDLKWEAGSQKWEVGSTELEGKMEDWKDGRIANKQRKTIGKNTGLLENDFGNRSPFSLGNICKTGFPACSFAEIVKHFLRKSA